VPDYRQALSLPYPDAKAPGGLYCLRR